MEAAASPVGSRLRVFLARSLTGSTYRLEAAPSLSSPRERIRTERGKCEGRKLHADIHPDAVLMAKRLAPRIARSPANADRCARSPPSSPPPASSMNGASRTTPNRSGAWSTGSGQTSGVDPAAAGSRPHDDVRARIAVRRARAQPHDCHATCQNSLTATRQVCPVPKRLSSFLRQRHT